MFLQCFGHENKQLKNAGYLWNVFVISLVLHVVGSFLRPDRQLDDLSRRAGLDAAFVESIGSVEFLLFKKCFSNGSFPERIKRFIYI